MSGRREHPAGGMVPAWAVAGLRPSAAPPPKPVRGQTDIYEVLDPADEGGGDASRYERCPHNVGAPSAGLDQKPGTGESHGQPHALELAT
jgi:hypothetical protein